MIREVNVYPLYYQPEKLYGDANGIKPYRSTVLIQILTNSGIDGWGECTGPLPMIVHEAEVLHTKLCGQDELQRQQILRMLQEATPRIRAAVDIALWDILGKHAGLPISTLLGGAVRERVPVYASLQSYSGGQPHDQWLQQLLNRIYSNHSMVKIKIGALPFAEDMQLIQKAIDMLPKGFGIAVDGNQSYDETSTRRLLFALRSYPTIQWLEEPMPLSLTQSYTRLKQMAPFAIAGGENLADVRSCIEWMQNDAADLIQPDILHIGGISELHLLYQYAARFSIRCSPHTFDSGLARLATLHVASTAKSYTKANIPWDIDPIEWDEMENPFTNLFEHTMKVEQGYVALPQAPGLGVSIRKEALREYIWDKTSPIPPIQKVPSGADGSRGSGDFDRCN
ncbi:mandelate racemase/muconate lactonizing enzyme family protein [Fodinisporobacter ferrooxydans]|uniref:Mandelate racemase/muconate lactonizing enzyme family protein n=1 Tax=Fodinisporobacter ferrooxydans TaxID=2901836 RepID=A0ABY4CQA5_9BACL|nr:mandelate racemase/muconate lactonizing enzyme family protein [Alicyclobacillaceae bacterium MYW30-H2]